MTIDPRPDIPLGYTHNTHGNLLTYKDSDGSWCEFTYDAAGRELACKDKTGLWTTLAIDPHYILRHNADTGIYWAGCREFTAEQALDHWSVRDDARAMQFTAAIINHLGKKETEHELHDSVAISWHIDDVAALAERNGVAATPEQCREVLRRAKANHDAEQGINWGVLCVHLTNVLTEGAQA